MGASRRKALVMAMALAAADAANKVQVIDVASSRAEKRVWVIDQSTLALRGEITIDGIGHQMAVIPR